MEIYGYSERGAMNALFYGMAFNNDEEAMHSFLIKAGIEQANSFHKFELYTEFSLSEFGSPDLVIFATKGDKKVVFFVEAKASCCKSYELKRQKESHDKYIENGEYDDGHASNLFFQLRLKNYFYQLKEWFCRGRLGDRPTVNIKDDKNKRILKTKNHYRGIGNNAIVQKFVDKFNDCTEAYYIAIIPEYNNEGIKTDYGFTIHYVSWSQIYNLFKERSEYQSLLDTIKFNQGKGPTIKSKNRIVSQILNNPIPDKYLA